MRGPHPALVVQMDDLNHLPGYGLTIVVPVTSKARPSYTYVELEPGPENGLSTVSWAKCEQVFTIPKSDLKDLLGKVDMKTLQEVRKRLAFVFGIG